MEINEITPKENKELADIIRFNFEKHNLDIPGTVYFDPELDNLSKFYQEKPQYRKYFVIRDNGIVCGGIGLAEFIGFEKCAEIQKFYLSEGVKGKGYGRTLLAFVESEARKMGYRCLYIETHTNFDIAYQMYCRHGYTPIERPPIVSHGAMNRFLLKTL